MNRKLKWILVITLNSILGFYFGLSSTQNDQFIFKIVGMLCGIATWSLIYIYTDFLLRKFGKTQLSDRLFLSAILRIPTQLFLYPEVLASGLSLYILESMLGLANANIFIQSYTLTLLTGFFLSLLCAFIFMAITIFDRLVLKHKTKPN